MSTKIARKAGHFNIFSNARGMPGGLPGGRGGGGLAAGIDSHIIITHVKYSIGYRVVLSVEDRFDIQSYKLYKSLRVVIWGGRVPLY